MFSQFSESRLSVFNLVLVSLFLVLIGFLIARYAPNNLSELQAFAGNALQYSESNPVFTTCLFIAVYIIANSIPVPFVSLFTVFAGYLFGIPLALIIVSFGNAIGASFLFLISRYLLKDWIQQHLINRSKWLSAGLKNDDFWYATSLRLLPGMPFSIPSIALSFTQISLYKFYLSTQIGMLFILFIYVNAGSQLTQLTSIDDIFNPRIIISMLLLALAPLLLKFINKRFLNSNS